MLNEVHKKVFSLAQKTAKVRSKSLLVPAKFPYKIKRISQKYLNFTQIFRFADTQKSTETVIIIYNAICNFRNESK